VIIYYEQKKYVFKIRERAIIKPGDVGILKRNNNKSEIAIMTCRPI
jgi:sortase (surface protein transpeptidase)